MPWFNPEYYAYLWTGLNEVFPGQVAVDHRPFPYRGKGQAWSPRSCFGFEVDGMLFSVDANDHSEISSQILEWSTVHARVNVLEADLSSQVVPLGPVFGVRAWGGIGALALASAFRRTRHPEAWGYRQLRATLGRQAKRLPVTDYVPTRTSERNLFYLGSFWSRHPEANDHRLMFLEAAHTVMEGRVQGGLVGPGDVDLDPRFRAGPINQSEYVTRVRRSPLVFNHDAVHGCLGWKLGEYLALGKAVLTTPIRNALPSPLIHGEHCHVVEPNVDAISEGIRLITNDDAYRRHLEDGAASWYAAHLDPATVIRRILTAANLHA